MTRLTELEVYDPQVISAYYSQRPLLVVGRVLQTMGAFLSFVVGLLWDKLTRQSPIARAEQLRQIITELGPTYIKVGQALSTRPDLVPPDFVTELAKLQDQLPAFSNEIAFRIIQEDLGKSPQEIYRAISPEPVAAASLGQVYKAQLHTGEDVAIKVQRPFLIPILTLDLYIIRLFARWFGPYLPLNLGNSLEAIVDEFGTKLFEEINYLQEARNAEQFSRYFQDDPHVKVPKIYWRYTTKRVLTLEWIHGIKLTDVETIKAAGLDRDQLIRIGVMSGLRQLLEFGFFHADPHPGNLFATYDGRMAYIDFGMMDQLDLQTKELLVDSVVHLINKDYEKLGEVYVKLGFLRPDTDLRPIVAALEAVFADIMNERVRDFNFKVVTDRFAKVMYDYPFCLPAKFALIIRSVITQEGVALTLNPDFRIVQIAYPYVAKRLLTDESESLRRRLLEVLFKDNRFQWHRLENLLRIARSEGDLNIIPTAHSGLRYLLSEEGKYIRNRILLALTEDNRLHVKEVLRLWELIKPEFKFSWGVIPQVVASVLPFTLFNSQ
ncbi:MAG: AarF/ABC1/UbiB kinase family protein [Pseudanabaenaceae cyanobacterium SKYGB_i_bin29]|nr:AarF/ABC1/UbiB kinase family protein [Pseudanabaenaceae cyanobacterium SKYG29]MDW8421385.1 AarF/ABC1/UbiB kinase family protein [Pseudanabaenaceae cyanobacterium SKYGB_i_bin29]